MAASMDQNMFTALVEQLLVIDEDGGAQLLGREG